MIDQLHVIIAFIVGLIIIVAMSVSTVVILILSKILEHLPFGPDSVGDDENGSGSK